MSAPTVPPSWVGATPPAIPDPAAAAALMSLRDCLCREVARTVYGAVCRCYVAWGAALPTQDGCSCDCGDSSERNGDAWVKLDSMEPDLTGTPSANEMMGWCAPAWTATMTLGIYRCIPVAEGENVMAADQVTDTSLALLSDMAALWRVLNCCRTTGPDINPASPGAPAVGAALDDGVRVIAWSPIDASGGCAGSSLTIQLPLSGASGCP
jgi:hypothetical protein